MAAVYGDSKRFSNCIGVVSPEVANGIPIVGILPHGRASGPGLDLIFEPPPSAPSGLDVGLAVQVRVLPGDNLVWRRRKEKEAYGSSDRSVGVGMEFYPSFVEKIEILRCAPAHPTPQIITLISGNLDLLREFCYGWSKPPPFV